MTFPRKNSILDDFPLCPQSPPPKNCKFYFYCRLTISDSLIRSYLNLLILSQDDSPAHAPGHRSANSHTELSCNSCWYCNAQSNSFKIVFPSGLLEMNSRISTSPVFLRERINGDLKRVIRDCSLQSDSGHPFSSPLSKNSRNTVYKLRFANVLGRINGDLKRVI